MAKTQQDRPKRNLVFHKTLVGLGPTRVTVDDEPRYVKSKDAFVVDLTVTAGNETEQVGYWCENETCQQFFKGQKGRTFTVIAEGARETATLQYVGEKLADKPLPPAPRSAPAQLPAQPKPAAATQAQPTAGPKPAAALPQPQPKPTAAQVKAGNGSRDKVDKLIDGLVHVGQVTSALALAAEGCFTAAEQFYGRMTGKPMSDSLKHAMAERLTETLADGETLRSVFISLDRQGVVAGLMPSKLTPELRQRALDRIAARIKAQSAGQPQAAATPEPPRQQAAAASSPAQEPEDDLPY